MILYINASPKLDKSNSEYFIRKIDNKASVKYLYKEKFEKLEFDKYDTILFSFPLYVDAPPNKVLQLFEYIDENLIDLTNKNIYVISNCGFLEAEQNDTAIEIMRNFAKKNKAKFMGSFKIGAGEIVGRCDSVKLYKFVNFSFLKKIKKFKKFIFNKQYIELETTIHPMTRKLYIKLANISWRRKCKKNHLKI